MSEQTHDVEIYICMNEDGDYVIDPDSAADATERAQSELGGETFRTVKVVVTMAAPVVSEATITVPDNAGETVAAQVAE